MRFHKGAAFLLALTLVFLASSCDLLFQKANSLLQTNVTISGVVSLPQSVAPGKYVYVGVIDSAPLAPSMVTAWTKYMQLSIAPGASSPFSLEVPSGKHVVCAFYDIDGDYTYDLGEPSGGYPAPTGFPLYDFTSNFGSAMVTIVANDVAPSVSLSSLSKSFFATAGGASPAPASIAVVNSGGGILDGLTAAVTYGSGASGWLTATLDKTSAPALLSLQASIGSLTSGTYVATVLVASTAAGALSQACDVSFTVSTAGSTPSLWLSPSNLSFEGSLGVNPASLKVNVNNGGGGTIDGLSALIAYSGATKDWLTASLDLTSTPAALTVQPKALGLVEGSYTATIVISSTTSGVAAQNVNVNYKVTALPAIALSPATLSFYAVEGGANPASGSVAIANSGSGTLAGLKADITYTNGTGWLSASVPTAAPGSMVVQAATGSLAAGTYTATIAVSSTQTGVVAQNLGVTFTVNSASANPAIGLTTSTMKFQGIVGAADPQPQSLTVSNAGGGTLSGLSAAVSYTSGSAWLVASLGGDTAPATLTVQPSLTTLAAGTYSAKVTVSSSQGGIPDQALDVTFIVDPPPPIIALSSPSLSFTAVEGGTDPASNFVTITNAGGGTLSGLSAAISYAAGSNWLGATFDTTSAPARLTLQPVVGTLFAGFYSATVLVSSSSAGVVAQSFDVSFTVAPRPKISLSPSSLSFSASTGGGNPVAQVVTINNLGGGSLADLALGTVAYGSGSGWLTTATLDLTKTPPVINVQPGTGTLGAGTYTATIPVTSTNASNTATLSLSFTVAQGVIPPTIGLSSNTLAFSGTVGGSVSGPQTLTITNTGGGALDTLSAPVTYTSGSGWLSTAIAGTASPYSLTVTAALGTLAAGTYTATIAVTSTAAGVTNSPQNITVTFTVAPPPPKIQLGSAAFTFNAYNGGALPAVQTDLVTNAGGGSLTQLAASVSYATGSGWLSASWNTTTAPATLSLQPNSATLANGTYNATVSVTSPVASNSPQSIAVTYVVAAQPVTGVTVTPTAATVSSTTTLSATVSPANAANKNVTWSSNNTAVATVSTTGLVTAVTGGSATITVTTVDGAKTATCAVTSTPTPTGLAVGSLYANSATISWASSGGLTTTYQLYRDTSATGTFATQVYTGTALSYVDKAMAPGRIYFYKVKATYGVGVSPLSAAVSSLVGTTWKSGPVGTTPTTALSITDLGNNDFRFVEPGVVWAGDYHLDSSVVPNTLTMTVPTNVNYTGFVWKVDNQLHLYLTNTTYAGGTMARAAYAPITLPSSGLIGQWLFSGNANDTSSYASTGTVSGTTYVADRVSAAGKALNFAGAGKATEVDTSTRYSSSIGLSFSFWINATTGATINNGYVMSESLNNAGEYHFLLNANSLALMSGGGSPLSLYSFPGGATGWTHFVVVWKLSTSVSNVQVYVNGVKQPALSYTGNFTYSGTILTFGARGTLTQMYTGVLDDVRMYSTLLSDADAFNLYNE